MEIGGSIDYTDQACKYSGRLGHIRMWSAYTEYGIQMIDTAFCRRIMKLEPHDVEGAAILLKEITDNPHLSQGIKDNLSRNIKKRMNVR